MEKLLSKRNTFLLVGLLTVWRLYLSATLQLHPDEAYYWLWSRNLDIAYFDHAPLVAYFIRFTTLISQSELWVRLSGTLVFLILSGLIWRLALQLFRSVPVAAGSVLLFNALPLSTLGLLVITPDTPVFLFWSLSVYLFWQIIGSQKTWLWYALGLSFGLALLSKYTAILLAPSLFIYLLLTDDRRWLKTVHPYLALLLGLCCFLPVLVWNSQHDWVSFTFQFKNGLGGEELAFSHIADYVGGQLLIIGPVTWLLGLYAALLGLYRRDKETLFLISAAIPVIVFFGASSLRKVAGPNWPAFAYFTFSILATQYGLGGTSKIRRALWVAAVVTSLAISALVTLHARFNVIPLERFSKQAAAADATNGFYGWRELGAELKQYPDRAFAITPSHQLSAEIIYYTDSALLARTARITRTSQFNLWSWSKDLQGEAGLYVWTDSDFIGHNGAYFAAPERSRAFTVYRDGKAVRTYHIILGQPHLTPPFPGD